MSDLTTEQMSEIIGEDNDDYEPIGLARMEGRSRWSVIYDQIFKRVSDNTFWEFSWTRGATEYQDEGPEGVQMCRVYPREVLTTVYEYTQT